MRMVYYFVKDIGGELAICPWKYRGVGGGGHEFCMIELCKYAPFYPRR
jgi:hypothetical protein